MTDGENVSERPVGKQDPEFHFVIRRFRDCPINCFCPLGSILRMNALQPFFPIGRALFWIETIYAIPLVGQVQHYPSLNPPNPTPHMGEPLCLRQITFAPAQRFCCTVALATGRLQHLVRPLQFLNCSFEFISRTPERIRGISLGNRQRPYKQSRHHEDGKAWNFFRLCTERIDRREEVIVKSKRRESRREQSGPESAEPRTQYYRAQKE